jgi:hypothetical protein
VPDHAGADLQLREVCDVNQAAISPCATRAASDAVAMLRSIGVKYLVVHQKAYEDPALRDELLRVIDEEPQVISHRTFDETTVAVLAPFDAPAVVGADGSALSIHHSARVGFRRPAAADVRWRS